KIRTITCDRKEFLGRNRSTANPAALGRVGLSGRTGAGLDPCAAIQSVIELAPGEERDVVLILGQAGNVEEAREVTSKYRQLSIARAAYEQVIEYWQEVLGTVEVKPPEAAMDTLL